MDNLFVISSECCYIIYMMNIFKTRYSIAHPLSKFNNDLFHHPIGKKIAKNMICLFRKNYEYYYEYIYNYSMVFYK